MPIPDQSHALSRRSLIAGLTISTITGSDLAVSGNLDAELLRLGRELEAAWAEDRRLEGLRGIPDAVYEAAYAKTGAVVREIERLPATTLEGLIVKARAVLWCHAGEPFTDTSFSDTPGADKRIAAGVLRDLIALRFAGKGQSELGGGNRCRIAAAASTVLA